MKRKLGLLPTPSASMDKRPHPDLDREQRTQTGDDLATAAGKLLPTPRASDQNRGGGIDHGQGGPSLPAAAINLLPTPSSWLGRRPENASPDPEREASRQHEGERGKRSIELPDALAKITLLPTPSSEESDPTDELVEEMQEAGISPDERLYLPGRTWHSQRTLSRVVPSLLPTPTSEDSERGPDESNREGGKSLKGSLLPTPQASDGTGGRQEIAASKNNWKRPSGAKASKPLGTAVRLSSGESTEPRSGAGKSSSGGLRLSPSFVEWLMGAPDGWTDPACPLSATEFSSRPDGYAGDGS